MGRASQKLEEDVCMPVTDKEFMCRTYREVLLISKKVVIQVNRKNEQRVWKALGAGGNPADRLTHERLFELSTGHQGHERVNLSEAVFPNQQRCKYRSD